MYFHVTVLVLARANEKMKRSLEEDGVAERHDYLALLTLVCVEAPAFCDCVAYCRWFSTCNKLWRYYRNMNPLQRLKLWEEKKEVARSTGTGKLHIYHRRNYVKLCDAVYIEKLMHCLEKEMELVFTGTIRHDEKYVSTPYRTGQILCAMADLTKILPYANLMQEYPLNLLSKCRKLIKSRYGWLLVLNYSNTNVEFAYPWKERNDHINLELLVVDKKERRKGI